MWKTAAQLRQSGKKDFAQGMRRLRKRKEKTDRQLLDDNNWRWQMSRFGHIAVSENSRCDKKRINCTVTGTGTIRTSQGNQIATTCFSSEVFFLLPVQKGIIMAKLFNIKLSNKLEQTMSLAKSIVAYFRDTINSNKIYPSYLIVTKTAMFTLCNAVNLLKILPFKKEG